MGAPDEAAALAAGDVAAFEARRRAAARAVVAHDDDERVLAELQFFEPGDELADELVRVGHHVWEVADLLRAFLGLGRQVIGTIGRRIVGRVRQHHRVIEEERPVLLTRDEVEGVVVDDVGSVFVLLEVDLLPVDFQAWVTVATGTPVQLPEAVLLEAEEGGAFEVVAQLPFPDHAGGVTGVLEEVPERPLLGIEVSEAGVVALVVQAGHQRHARRRAQRLGMDLVEPHAGRGELVHHRGAVTLAAVGRDALIAEVVDQDEHHVRLRRRGEGESGEAGEREKPEQVHGVNQRFTGEGRALMGLMRPGSWARGRGSCQRARGAGDWASSQAPRRRRSSATERAAPSPKAELPASSS